MSTTSIEWTEHTWNCLAGCEAVSPGCTNCYAATMTRRLEAMGQADYSGLTTDKHFNGVVRCLPHKLDIPLKRRKPTTYFVNSMSDLFHEDVPHHFISRVFGVMASCPQHTFQILTKRAERMCFEVQAIYESPKEHNWWPPQWWHRRDVAPLPNVWLGVSTEDQKRADERIPWLLKTPAAVRFLSCEPLLGPIQLRTDAIRKASGANCDQLGYPMIDWVIVGGESGHGARPMQLEWAQSLVDQCEAAVIACFVKQLGSNAQTWDAYADGLGGVTGGGGITRYGTADKKGGDPAEWPEDLRVRQMPNDCLTRR